MGKNDKAIIGLGIAAIGGGLLYFASRPKKKAPVLPGDAVLPPGETPPLQDWMGNTYPDNQSMEYCIATSDTPEALQQCSIDAWQNYTPPIKPRLLTIFPRHGEYSINPEALDPFTIWISGLQQDVRKYNDGEAVNVSVVAPPAGTKFSHWASGPFSFSPILSYDPTISIVMDSDKTLAMHFVAG